MKVNTANRDWHFELLRILSMLAIVISHVAAFGTWNSKLDPVLQQGWRGAAWQTFDVFGQVGVTLFTLTSAYFLSGKKTYNVTKRITSTWANVISISVFCFIVLTISQATLKAGSWDLHNLFSSIFPIINNKYWYATAYIFLLLLSPFLNLFCKTIGINKLKDFIFIMFFIFFFLPYLNPHLSYFNDIIYLGSIYLIGCLIRMRRDLGISNVNNIKTILIIIFSFIFVFFGSLFARSENPLSQFMGYPTNFFGAGNHAVPLASVVAGISLFWKLVNLRDERGKESNRLIDLLSKCILRVSPYMFGVYLFHTDSNFMSLILNRIYLSEAAPGIINTVIAISVKSIVIFLISLIFSIIIQQLIVNRLKYVLSKLNIV